MSKLMIGISGVRGVVGDNLTPELLVNLGQAYGTWAEGGKVVVGRDTRASGDMVKHAVFSGLLSAGCRIVDVGVCGTPSAAMMIRKLNADGGIVISASHNPIEWNALKFFREDGVYLNQEQGRQLLDIYYGGDSVRVGYDRIHAVELDGSAEENHLEKVLPLVDVEALRKRKFRVAIDCCNGAGSSLALKFLHHVGCEMSSIYCDMNGSFERNPEPTRSNIVKLLDVVRDHKADIGFAQDADADRIAIVSEKSEYIGEEYSLCLATKYRLMHEKGPVVANLSSTRMVEDIAKEHGCKVLRTPVGEVNVAEAMVEHGAVIGGEGNGGVIDPRVHLGRDALTGMALMLQLMLETGKTISQLVAEIPSYHMSKQKVTIPRRNIAPILKKIAEEPALSVDIQDGVKLDFEDSWVHVRPSNTEPIVRVYAEAKKMEDAEILASRYRIMFENLTKVMHK